MDFEFFRAENRGPRQTAEVLSAYGMNLEDSSMTLLRGHFAMTLICAGRAEPAALDAALTAALDLSLIHI